MNLSELQKLCLQTMGITVFETRQSVVYDYLVCIEESRTPEKQQLLTRMLAALRWSVEQCEIVWSASAATIEQKVAGSACKKAIIFSERETASTPSLVVLPSLNTLLTDLSAKKAAWQKMQPLINYPGLQPV